MMNKIAVRVKAPTWTFFLSILLCAMLILHNAILPITTLGSLCLLLSLGMVIFTYIKGTQGILDFSFSVGASLWLLRSPGVFFSTPHSMLQGQSITLLLLLGIGILLHYKTARMEKILFAYILIWVIWVFAETYIVQLVSDLNTYYFSWHFEFGKWLLVSIPFILLGVWAYRVRDVDWFRFAIPVIPFWIEYWIDPLQEVSRRDWWTDNVLNANLLIYKIIVPLVFFLLPIFQQKYYRKPGKQLETVIFYSISTVAIIAFRYIVLADISSPIYATLLIMHGSLVVISSVIAVSIFQKLFKQVK